MSAQAVNYGHQHSLSTGTGALLCHSLEGYFLSDIVLADSTVRVPQLGYNRYMSDQAAPTMLGSNDTMLGCLQL
jgi:hypothetical protein